MTERIGLSTRLVSVGSEEMKYQYIDRVLSDLFDQKAKVILGEDNIEEGVMGVIIDDFNLEESSFDTMTYCEFIVRYLEFIKLAEIDRAFGSNKYERRGLPLQLIIGDMLRANKKNRYMTDFLALDYETFMDYLVQKINKKETSRKQYEGKTILQVAKLCKDKMYHHWTPGEDLEEYVLKITDAITETYVAIFEPLAKAAVYENSREDK